MLAAAEASSTLLYDSALPWSGGAPVANGPSARRAASVRASVAGGGLVRVLAVAQRLDLLERQRRAPAGTDPPTRGSPGSAGSATPASSMRHGSSAAIRAS